LKVPKRAPVSYPNKPKAWDTSATPDQLNAAAEKATYSPSPYHCPDRKGHLASRSKPTMHCAEGWSDRQIGEFPRYVWHRAGDTWYEAQTNTGTAGQYHAYPGGPARFERAILAMFGMT
jgi:hypothetical protein